jgi:hypothetical protein
MISPTLPALVTFGNMTQIEVFLHVSGSPGKGIAVTNIFLLWHYSLSDIYLELTQVEHCGSTSLAL